MDEKQQAITSLREMYERWEALLASMSEAQITASRSPDMSIKDVIAHLWGWQQVSVARMDAALHDREPVYPGWSLAANPDDGDKDETNARIDALSAHKTWSEVHEDWRTQFLQFLELAEAVPEHDLVTEGRYAWFYPEYALLGVVSGSYEHHEEHLEALLAE